MLQGVHMGALCTVEKKSSPILLSMGSIRICYIRMVGLKLIDRYKPFKIAVTAKRQYDVRSSFNTPDNPQDEPLG